MLWYFPQILVTPDSHTSLCWCVTREIKTLDHTNRRRSVCRWRRKDKGYRGWVSDQRSNCNTRNQNQRKAGKTSSTQEFLGIGEKEESSRHFTWTLKTNMTAEVEGLEGTYMHFPHMHLYMWQIIQGRNLVTANFTRTPDLLRCTLRKAGILLREHFQKF